MRGLTFLTVLVTFTGAINIACAQTKTWVGGASDNWNNAANWNPSGVPAATDDVLIPSGAQAVVINDARPGGANWSVFRLTLERQLNISNVNLEITGGGLVMNNSTIATGVNSCNTIFRGLIFNGLNQSITGNGLITTEFAGCNSYGGITTNGVTVTVGSGITLRTLAGRGILSTNAIGTINFLGTARASTADIQLSGNFSNITSLGALVGGTWFTDGANLDFSGGLVNNQPILEFGQGTIVKFKTGTFIAGTSNNNFTRANVNRGTISAEGGFDPAFAPDGGLFQNFGTIALQPGSIMDVSASGSATAEFRNRAGSILDLSLSGSGAATQQSRVTCDGLARLDGNITVRFLGSFEPDCTPVTSKLFPLASGTSKSGNFATQNINWPAGYGGSIDYTSTTKAELVTQNTPFGPCGGAVAPCDDIDFNNDTSVFDPCDINSFLVVYSEGPCTPCGQ